jgi:hypothetical protein
MMAGRWENCAGRCWVSWWFGVWTPSCENHIGADYGVTSAGVKAWRTRALTR